jgi:hypothetical protein
LIWLAETLLIAGRIAEAWPHLGAALETVRRHGRALLHLQAERLRGCMLAADGNWPAAQASFTQTLAQATNLDLPLEIARTQAAWGQAIVRFAPSPQQAYALIGQAQHVFADHQAIAELNGLETTLQALHSGREHVGTTD